MVTAGPLFFVTFSNSIIILVLLITIYCVDATAGGRFVPECITSPVVSTSMLTSISSKWSF